MMDKHTLGPWRVGDAGLTVFGPPRGEPAPKVIARASGNGPVPSEETRANILLIAAAPELLIACRYALRVLDCEPENAVYKSHRDIVAAAIATAEGRDFV